MLPLEATSNASMSSLLESAKPTSDPSKYMDQVPLVVFPNVVDVNANISSSLPVRPGTDESPVVEIRIRSFGSTDTESMYSVVVSKPTSLPSKYMLNVPAVVLPREVASKRKISWGVAVNPFTVTLAVNDIRIESGSRSEKEK